MDNYKKMYLHLFNEVTKAIEILKIEKLDQTIAMVPFVNEFIGEIDLEEEKIEIIPIEGLLWELMC